MDTFMPRMTLDVHPVVLTQTTDSVTGIMGAGDAGNGSARMQHPICALQAI